MPETGNSLIRHKTNLGHVANPSGVG